MSLSGMLEVEKRYGPFAFGLVAVLLLWKLIFSPQLQETRIDYEELQKITAAQRETAALSKQTADILIITSNNLERQAELTAANSDVLRELVAELNGK